MIIELTELVKSWPMLAQVITVILVAGMGTLVSLALISMVGDFINGSLPVLLRGYNPYVGQIDEPSETEEK
jgi:hypothetical protein